MEAKNPTVIKKAVNELVMILLFYIALIGHYGYYSVDINVVRQQSARSSAGEDTRQPLTVQLCRLNGSPIAK